MGKWDILETRKFKGEPMAVLIETDDRSRVVLTGHSNQKFIMHENADGSLLLEPARVVSEAQYEYDQTPDLRELLDRARTSPTVQRSRDRRVV
jgi:hypothetical protein